MMHSLTTKSKAQDPFAKVKTKINNQMESLMDMLTYLLLNTSTAIKAAVGISWIYRDRMKPASSYRMLFGPITVLCIDHLDRASCDSREPQSFPDYSSG